MPNHCHMILIIENSDKLSNPPKLQKIIGGYKSGVSRICGFSIWHRSYYDNIIRNNDEYIKISKYIENNSINWKEDIFYNLRNNN